jgi:anti-sigma factor ChrR (cupin superfamily)
MDKNQSENGFVFDTNAMDWWDYRGQKLKINTAPNGISFVLSELTPDVESIYHIHEGFECIYILEGSVISNGETFVAGQGFIANKGSEHKEFRTQTGAKFIVVNSKD